MQTSGGTFHDIEAGSFIGEMALDGVVAGVTAGATNAFGKSASRAVVGESLKEAGGGGIQRYAAKRSVETVVSKPFGAATKGVGNKLGEELK